MSPRYVRRFRCDRKGCMCTHVEPCEFGWIENPTRWQHGTPYESVRPCPVCRPEQSLRLDQALVRNS